MKKNWAFYQHKKNSKENLMLTNAITSRLIPAFTFGRLISGDSYFSQGLKGKERVISGYFLSRVGNSFSSLRRDFSSIHQFSNLGVLPPEEEAPMGPTRFDPSASRKVVYKFIVGMDQGLPKAMSSEEVENSINDPFANLFLKKGFFPLTMEQIKSQLDRLKEIEEIDVFLIAENGQIAWRRNADNVDQTARLVLNAKATSGIGLDILVSTGTSVNSSRQFLQLMSWDNKSRSYNFYQRLQGFWIWSGNGFHALDPKTRAKGPFSGHVNGGPVMKELRSPWQHWNSSEATIFSKIFSENDPFVSTEYFTNRKKADRFEIQFKAGISAWNESRIDHAIGSDGKTITRPNDLLRQILSTTNLNLISSPDSSQSQKAQLTLPFTFFANFFALEKTGLIPIVDRAQVSRTIYEQALSKFDFSLRSGTVNIPGDTHFAFFVPEPAFEDIDLLDKMIHREIISRRLAACILMVDFQNPIHSLKRSKLEHYVPLEITAGDQGASLDKSFVENIQNSKNAKIEGSAEHEFLTNWLTGNNGWESAFENRITTYFEKIQSICNTQKGFDGFVQLAESRRHRFKQTGLFEFELTFPRTNISSEKFPLEMNLDGSVSRAKEI